MHPTQINLWKKEAVNNLSSVFGKGSDEEKGDKEEQMDKLYSQIGQLKVENDFLKKDCTETIGRPQAAGG